MGPLPLAADGPDIPTSGMPTLEIPAASLKCIGGTPEELEKMQVWGLAEEFRRVGEEWRRAA
jgi:hypothetical protein